MPVTVRFPVPGTIHASFPNKKEMTLTLCRVQEYYESSHDHIRGKHFTWIDFIDTFTDERGRLDYFSFWSGFNFPGSSYLRFLQDFEGDLSAREDAFRRCVLSATGGRGNFYVIGTLEGAEATIKHELLHALYCVDSGYRQSADALLADLDGRTKAAFSLRLEQLGYGPNVLNDEIQAYLGSGGKDELDQRFGLELGLYDRYGGPFRDLATKHLASGT